MRQNGVTNCLFPTILALAAGACGDNARTEVDCTVACDHRLAICAEGCLYASCTRSLSREGCMQECDQAPAVPSMESLFQCLTVHDTCEEIQVCMPVSLKTCVNNAECCFSDDDCVEGEFCQGTGACDSEGTCEPIVGIPCPLAVDLGTGELVDPVCGCNGVTYQGACQATSSGHRISHDGRCETACSSNEDCDEGEYCHGDGPCDSPGFCRLIPPIDCGWPLNPDGSRDETAEVCGCDGVTYYSGCAAVTGGVRIAFEGACP